MSDKVLGILLEMERCPHCGVDRPSLKAALGPHKSIDHRRTISRTWKVYVCQRCGGAVLAWSEIDRGTVRRIYPDLPTVDSNIPIRARTFLMQAIDTVHAPSGSIMLSASTVDAMLQEKGLIEGKLYHRIKEAEEKGIITSEMARWAHDIRLDANDERHADEKAPFPDEAQARKCVDFALALAEFLFVLPARVERGLKEAKATKPEGDATPVG